MTRAPLPRVLCRGFRSSTGVHFRCLAPVMQPGEPGGAEESGQCATCRAQEETAWQKRRVREGRKLLRDKARGYHLDPGKTPWDALTRGR